MSNVTRRRSTYSVFFLALAAPALNRVIGYFALCGESVPVTFVTLEDETGLANLVIKPEIWDRYYRIARSSSAWIAHGRLESRDSVIHVVVNRLEDLSARMGAPKVKSRDFR